MKVRSVLTGMFQQTVVEAAVKIFELIDNHLPYAISQVDDPNARPSAFDALCDKLKGLEAVEDDRDRIRDALEQSLSGVVIKEVRKLLKIAEETAQGEPGAAPNPTGLRISLEGDTERRLGFIAAKVVTSNKMERGFGWSRWCAFVAFAGANVSGILVAPWLFIEADWAFKVAVAFLALFGVALIIGISSVIWFYRCQHWLEETAARYTSPGDWFGEVSQHKVR